MREGGTAANGRVAVGGADSPAGERCNYFLLAVFIAPCVPIIRLLGLLPFDARRWTLDSVMMTNPIAGQSLEDDFSAVLVDRDLPIKRVQRSVRNYPEYAIRWNAKHEFTAFENVVLTLGGIEHDFEFANVIIGQDKANREIGTKQEVLRSGQD